MLKVKQFVFNPFGENTYIIWDEASRDAMVIDPGMGNSKEEEMFDKYIADNKLNVKQIVNTHLHLDHCFGDNYVRNRYGAKIHASADDASLGRTVASQASMFGLAPDDSRNVSIDVPLADGDTITLGNYTFDVLAVPGHSPGGIALYCPKGEFAIVGDSIFAGAIGRTDLPGGDYSTLIDALRRKILSLPDNTRLLTGHDRSTTVGQERASNPYLR